MLTDFRGPVQCSTHPLDRVTALNPTSGAQVDRRISTGDMADGAGRNHPGEEEDGESGGNAVEHSCGGR